MKTLHKLISNLLVLWLSVGFVHAQIPNPGFENWSPDRDGILHPDGWETSNSGPLIGVTRVTDAHQGTYAIRVAVSNMVVNIPGSAITYFPLLYKPNALRACIKTGISGSDLVSIIFTAYSGDSLVARPEECTFVIDSAIGTYTCFDFPISYTSDLVPDSAIITFLAGSLTAQVGTWIQADALELTSPNTGVVEPIYKSLNVYPNPASHDIYIQNQGHPLGHVLVRIYDAQGKLIHESESDENGRVHTGSLPSGIYCVYAETDGRMTMQKFCKE